MKKVVSKLKPSKLWFVDNLSGVTFGNALSACLENYVYGLSAQESLDARVSSTIMGLVFANKAYTYSRDKSREIFDIDLKKSTSKKINIHDSLYSGAFTFAYCLGMYELVTDQIFYDNCVNSGLTAGVYTILGSALSYNIDSFRDFFGISENPKLPNKVKLMSSKSKKKLAAGVLAGYTTLFSSNYAFSDIEHKIKSINFDKVSSSEMLEESFDYENKRYGNLESLIEKSPEMSLNKI